MLVFVFFLQLPTVTAQYNDGNCPVNIDFETGNFTNWQTFSGNPGNLAGMILGSPNALKHKIIERQQNIGIMDPYGGFPIVCPNGSGYSVKLGNNAGGEAEKLKYIFNIPSGSNKYSIVVYYAIVLQDAAHAPQDQPKFLINVSNASTNQPLGCTSFDFTAGAGMAGFNNVMNPNGTIRYKNWTPLTVDLSGYAGQQVALEFTTTDCTQGVHFGYAYVDVASNCIAPIVGQAYCVGANSVTLTAPLGYQFYNWWNSSFTTSYGTGNSVTLSPAPPPGTIINVDITPFNGFGCRDTLQAVLGTENAPPVPIVPAVINYCEGQIAAPIPVTVLPGYYPKWYLTPAGGTALNATPYVNTSASNSITYYVSQVSFGGCEGPRSPVTINVDEIPVANFSINDTIQCVFGNNFQFTNSTIPNYPSTQYQWDFGNGNTINAFNPTYQYPSSGNYNVQLIAKKGICADTAQIPVQVINSPVANFIVSDSCEKGTFIFTSTSITGANSAYTWDLGFGQTSTLQNPTATYANAGTVPVKLTVTMGLCTHDTTKLITVHAIPKANFVYNSLCTRDSIQFVDASSVSLGTLTNWTWDFGGGVTSASQNPKMAFQNYGNNAVKLTASTAYCAKDTTIQVNVLERPVAKFTQVDTACIAQLFTVRDNSYFVSGNTANSVTAWHWQAPNGTVTNTSTTTMQQSVAGVHTIKLVAKSNQNCASDTGYFDIVIRNAPIPKISFLTSLCENRNIIASDITVNSATRNWYLNSLLGGTEKQYSVNNLPSGPQTLRLTMIDSFGCKSLPKDTTFVVRKRPSFSFIHLDSCVEKTVPFIATDNDVNNISQWHWTYEGATVQGTNTQNILFSKYGNTSVAVYGVDAFGCYSDTLTKNITLHYNPVFAGNDTLAAANEPVQLQAKTNINSTYLWSTSAGLSNATIANPIATNTNDQTYTVTATSIYGCKSSDNITIRIYKGPEVYIPTAFTPNNDGINDVLKITPVGIKNIKSFAVYNKFGNKVFESQSPQKSWDGTFRGKNIDAGAYVYVLDATKADGTQYIKKGTVMVLR